MKEQKPQKINPLLAKEGLPAFGEIQAEHVVPAVQELLAETEEKLRKVEEESKGWGLIEDLNQIEYELHRVWGPVMHLLGVKNSPELREAQEEVQKDFVSFCLRMEQSKKIYDALLGIQKGMEQEEEKASQKEKEKKKQKQRILELRLRAAFHSGVGLEKEKRERFNAIVTELSQLNTDFSNNVLDAVKDFAMDLKDPKDIEGLPPSALSLAALQYWEQHKEETKEGEGPKPEIGPWRITLDAPSYLPFMKHAHKRELREKLYRAFISKASKAKYNNTGIIIRILKLRQEQARLLGFQNYAEMRMDTRMAQNTKEVYDLIEELRGTAWQHAKKELEELENFAREKGQKGKLAQWDLPYFSEALREKNFGFTEEELRPYFPLEHILEGLFALAKNIFGLTIRPADGKAPVWHPDVRYFSVQDDKKDPIAFFYLDPYSRPAEKRGGAWMDDCIGRRKYKKNQKEKLDLPVAYLVCNATPPLDKEPALMNFREVETLFHEFGHGLQHMLTKIDYPDVAGINGIEWDAVELPSQFMENWCYHRPTLLSLSCHIKTGEALPEEMFKKIQAARNFGAALQLLRQLRFALIDMELHDHFDPSSSSSSGEEALFSLQKKIDEKSSLIPSLPEDRFLCSFSHIFAGGYAAGYYSYKWAEVLAADAFSAFEEAGLEDPKALKAMGKHFRDTILALGGSQAPALVYKAFRGRKASTEALLRHSGLAA